MLALEILTCLKYAFDKDWIGFIEPYPILFYSYGFYLFFNF